jgi:hypothetical protein
MNNSGIAISRRKEALINFLWLPWSIAWRWGGIDQSLLASAATGMRLFDHTRPRQEIESLFGWDTVKTAWVLCPGGIS